jgi:Nucleotide-diphospho-sugar transferase
MLLIQTAITAISGLFYETERNFDRFYNFDCIEIPFWDDMHSEILANSISPNKLDDIFGSSETIEKSYEQCPLGLITLAVIQSMRLNQVGASEKAGALLGLTHSLFKPIPFIFLAQSRWPFFDLLTTTKSEDEAMIKAGSDFCCKQKSGPILDWTGVQSAVNGFSADMKMNATESGKRIGGYTAALFSQGNQVVEAALDECLCGVVILALAQCTASSERLTQYLVNWAKLVADFLRTYPFKLYVNSEWPMTRFLSIFSDVRKGDKYMKYNEQMNKNRRRYSDLLPSLSNILLSDKNYQEAGKPYDEIIGKAASNIKGRKLVPFTLVYGDRWLPLITRFVNNFAKLGLRQMLIATIGEEGQKTCETVAGQAKADFELVCMEIPSLRFAQIHRYTTTLLILQAGFDAFYFDLDTFFAKLPFDYVVDQLKDDGSSPDVKDILFSHHADSDCLNNGIYYVTASDKTKEFFRLFIDWMHKYNYELDQRGFNDFLNHSQKVRVSFPPTEDLKRLKMTYGILDDQTRMIIPDRGWTGNYQEIIVIHYASWTLQRKMEDLDPLYDTAEAMKGEIHETETFQNIVHKYWKEVLPRDKLCW